MGEEKKTDVKHEQYKTRKTVVTYNNYDSRASPTVIPLVTNGRGRRSVTILLFEKRSPENCDLPEMLTVEDTGIIGPHGFLMNY